MPAQKIILAITLIIIVLASTGELIFNGFALRPILIMAAAIAIVAFLWFFPRDRRQ
ncbi:hypothetical protein ACQCT6_02920 [Cytobacillus gottheilii]|uniref:Uncharacterized protein n=1 Tax=Cytobacillus gottheilii TaxID=859144 RepID=A0ABX8F8K8_9BACI|nr:MULTISPECIES: hypothetical protein [Bacillaceae]QVY60450.1 hypothetical protein J1899_15710 [Cytobacillus gottheilii]